MSKNPYIYGKHAVGDIGVSASWRVRGYSLARRGPELNYGEDHPQLRTGNDGWNLELRRYACSVQVQQLDETPASNSKI
jgi:hypothetical protein